MGMASGGCGLLVTNPLQDNAIIALSTLSSSGCLLNLISAPVRMKDVAASEENSAGAGEHYMDGGCRDKGNPRFQHKSVASPGRRSSLTLLSGDGLLFLQFLDFLLRQA